MRIVGIAGVKIVGAVLDGCRSARKLPTMKARRTRLKAEQSENGSTAAKPGRDAPAVTENRIDQSLLDESLSRTPWERMQANDDALRFAEALRSAMETRNAKS
jgi:hypothetical protein